MRTLTIRRRKSFAGSASKVKIYISDPISGDLDIAGEQCRLLGTVKNGREASFSIEDSGARIYAIFSKSNRNTHYGKYPLVAGTEDVTLEGEYRMDSGIFRFDGVAEDLNAAAKRKKATEKQAIIYIAVFFAIIVLLNVINDATKDPKIPPADQGAAQVYTVEDLRITMTEDFEDIEPEGYDRVLQKGMCVAMFMEEPFTNLEGMEELSVEEYYSLLRFYNSAVSQSLTEQGITYVQSQYQNPETGILWHYMLVAYKGTDAFWLVEFAVPENKWEEMKHELLKWAASVEITP